MARNERSQVQFDINITGAQNIKNLTSRLDKLLSKLRQVDKYQEKMGGGSGVSGSGTRGSVSNLKKGDISNRMSQIKLGFRKGDIRNVKQMQGHYGRLVRELNRLESEGKNVANMRLRAYKLNQRLTNSIKEKRQAIQRTTQAKSKLTGITNKQRASMVSNMGAMSFGQSKLRGATNQLKKSAGATKNASYTLLNMGYLIQDSPYGIRGMANNVSQLVQSYQMLGQQISMINKKQGKNLTVWGQLGKMLKGPTGIMILLGSLLPAAMEYISMYWDELTFSQEQNILKTEDHISALKDYIKWSDKLRKSFGADPLGLGEMRSKIEQLDSALSKVEKLTEARDKLANLKSRSRIRQFGQLGGGIANILGIGEMGGGFEEKIKSQQLTVDQLIKKYKELSGVDLSPLREELKKLRAQAQLKEHHLADDPGAQLIAEYTANIERIEKKYKQYKQVGNEKMMEHYRQKMKELRKLMEANLESQLESGGEFASSYSKILKSINESSPLGDDEEDEEDKWYNDINLLKLTTGFENPEDFTKKLRGIESGWNKYWTWQEEQAVEQATTKKEKLKHLEKQKNLELDELNRKYQSGEIEGYSEYLLKKNKITNGFTETRKGIIEDYAVHEIKMQKMTLKQGMNNPSDIDAQKSRIKSLYDFKRQEIKETTEEGIERKRKLAQVDINEQQRMKQATQQYNQRKRQLIKQSASVGITSVQAVAQATNASAKSQFQIQKVASASQAIINGYLAYTKTMAQGGFLAQPLAITAMLSSFAQAGKIMSQSFDSAKATGAGGVGGASVGYRGLNFTNSQSSMLNSRTQSQPYAGTSTGLNKKSSSPKKNKGKVEMEITDGYDNIVGKGLVKMDANNMNDLGYWTGRGE